MSKRSEDNSEYVAQNPPRPVVESYSHELSSIPRVLAKLGRPPEPGELGDSPEDKAAVLRWLNGQTKKHAKLHPHLLQGLRLRQWINEEQFLKLWDITHDTPADE